MSLGSLSYSTFAPSVQRLEAVAGDPGVMDEQIRAYLVRRTKPNPLSSLNHFTVPVGILLITSIVCVLRTWRMLRATDYGRWHYFIERAKR